MCPSSIIGWFEIAALAGAAFLAVRRLRRETALWAGDHRSPRVASLLCAAEHAAGSRPAAYGEYALSHVGFLSACGPSGGRGRKRCWPRGCSDGGAQIQHGRRRWQAASLPRSQYFVWVRVIDPNQPRRARTRTARSSPDRARAGEQGTDHRLSPTAHRLEAGRRIPRLCQHVPWRAGRAGPQA